MRSTWGGMLAVMLSVMCAFTAFAQDKVIQIGYVTEMTGAESYIAQGSLPALEDRIAEVNAAGGIEGYTLKLVAYDTRSEVTDAITVSKRLMEQDKVVAIIGPSWSAAAIPLAEMAAASQVPVIATAASNINVTVSEDGKLQPYMFRVCFIDPYQGYALADFAFNKLKLRKAAFLTDVASPYTVAIHDYFEKHFVELGGEIVAKEGYQTGDVEFRAQLATIQNSGTELLVAAAYTYKDAGLIAQQAESLGVKITLMGADGWFADDLLPMAGPQLEGAYLSTGVATNAPEFAEFNAALEKKHGVKANIFTYYGLDALYAIEYAIKAAIAKTGSPTPVAVRDALETMQDVQLFTSKITMEPDTHNPHNKPLLIVRIHDSKWEIIETFTPQQ